MSSPEEMDRAQAERFVACRREASALSGFLRWLDEQGMRICLPSGPHHTQGEEWVSAPSRHEELLARYYDIDLDAVERHRLRVLDEHRAMYKEASHE